MKLAVSALLIASVAGFSDMSMTFSLSKKPAAAKPAPKVAATQAVPKKVVVVKAAAPAAAKAVPKAAPVVAKAAPKAAPKVVAKAAPAPKVVVKAAPKVVAKPAPAPKVVAKVARKVVAKPAPKPVAKIVAKPAPKKIVVKAAPPKKTGPSIPSQALPWTVAPAALDGSLLGDFGFDPLGLSTPKFGQKAPRPAIGADLPTLTWYREAELMHGRIAQLAAVGFIWPGLFGTFPGNDLTGLDAYSATNPLEAFGKVPSFALLQILAFMMYLETRRVKIIKEEGAKYMPGDQRLGQTGYNPFGLNYTPAEYEEKRLQELKHCRLAMLGVFGLWAQASLSGVGIVEQLGNGLTIPTYAAKAGYFLPEGI